jgi:metallopeptidase MepB
MMFENWCWLKDELKAMSCHYTRVDPTYKAAWLEENPGRDLPSEKIPDDLLDRCLKARARMKLLSVKGDL